MAGREELREVAEGVFLVPDTCNVYLVRSGRSAFAVDFGSGVALRHLDDLGVDRLEHVLVTHHHRDQVHGLSAAAAAGAQIWVPPVEQDSFRFAAEAWQSYQLDNNYDVLQDRFGPLDTVAVSGTMPEYLTVQRCGLPVTTIPTPGHTIGSVSYLVEVGGQRLAFTGDLIAAPGKVWSLAATQWSYNGIEGVGATWHSARVLAGHAPTMLLPSHGRPITEVPAALDLLCERLERLVTERGTGCEGLATSWARPYRELSPHLLMNRTSISRSYALLSDTGRALLIDFGYDFSTGLAPAGRRSSRRPLLATLADLKARHGVERIDVAVPTHYHDDHVAGFNLLRDVEGTQVWAAANFAAILERPLHYDLPCLWYDPIPVDRTLPLGIPLRWQEYELTLYELPGHTLYACAIAFEVDGERVVATGDQQGTVPGVEPEFLNYTYRNRFDHRDFEKSALLYQKLSPGLMISGHWDPRWVDQDYLDRLLAQGRALAEIHELLLPLDSFDVGADGVAATIRPYRSQVRPGDTVSLSVEVRNPFAGTETCQVHLEVPPGWGVEPAVGTVTVSGGRTGQLPFLVRTGPAPVRRARVAGHLTWGALPLGPVAEALISVGEGPMAP